jgi:hypothetical protein
LAPGVVIIEVVIIRAWGSYSWGGCNWCLGWLHLVPISPPRHTCPLGGRHTDPHAYTTVALSQGVNQGGLVGSLAFPRYMDTLVHTLAERDCGVGMGICMPTAEWAGMTWRGDRHQV